MASRKKPPTPARSTSIDEQFDAFLKASIGSDSDTSLSKYVMPKARKEKPWWQSSVDTSEEFDSGSGLGAHAKSFLKKKKAIIPPIAPKTPEADARQEAPKLAKEDDSANEKESHTVKPLEPGNQRESAASGKFLQDITTGPFSARVSRTEPSQRSSKLFTETDEFRESQLSFDPSTETGHETLEEAADKSRFFKKLAADADGTLDYSQLNRQLGDTGQPSLLESTNQRMATIQDEDGPAHHDEDPADFEGGASHFDDDYGIQQEDRPATFQGNEPEPGGAADAPTRPSLLANVSLNDTLDTSLQATTAEAPAPDLSGGMGNTSQLDYEAVHQAYQEVHDKKATTDTLPFTNQHEGAHAPPVNQSDEFTAETTQRDDEVPVWQNSSRREGESQATSIWDLQPVAEARTSPLPQQRNTPSTHSSTSTPRKRAKDVASKQEGGDAAPPQPSVWDLLPISQSDPSSEHASNAGGSKPHTEVAGRGSRYRDGRVTPPTAVEYQTIDQLSPIHHEQAFPSDSLYDSHQSKRTSKNKLRKSMGKTQTLQLSSLSAKSRSSTDKFGHVKSSGYGVVHASPTRSKTSSPKAKPTKKGGKSKSPSTSRHYSPEKEPETMMSKESSPIKVLQSVESFANYLRDQFISSTPASKIEPPYFTGAADGASVSAIGTEKETALLNEVREWQQKWREECRMNEKLNADFVSAQRQWERQSEENRLKHEQQLGSLRQQVYILEAKQASLQQTGVDESAVVDSTVKDTISRLESEIQSQEKLISGYQQENERLYKEIKQSDSLHKATYERLYQENHKQAAELAQLREVLSQKDVVLKGKYGHHPITQDFTTTQPVRSAFTEEQPNKDAATPMTAALGAGRIAELKSQLLKSKSDNGALAASVTVLTQKNTDLSTQLEYLTKERDNLKETVLICKQPAEVRVIQDRYQQEINVLEKRIQWYIDNQRILDTDLERLRQKDCEINQLNNKIRQLEEQKAKSYDGTQRAKDRAGDTKRIKDLERQVKEMEQIIRRRNPNSIPSLIWAASVMPDSQESKTPSMKFLEERVEKLEKELAEKDGETSRLLRAMEQRCYQSKLMYEEKVAELESTLVGGKGEKSETNRHTTLSAVEKELSAAREQHRKRQQEQQSVIDSLREEIARLKHNTAVELKSETRALRKSCDQGEMLASELRAQLESKMGEVATLHNKIERLQKEKRQLLVELNHVQSVSSEWKEQQGQSSPGRQSKSSKSKTQVVTVFSPERRKSYEADKFSAEHISDVLEMNKALAVKYEECQLELSQLRVDHQRKLAELEKQMREEQSELQTKLKRQELESQREKENLIAKYALKQSENDLTKYKNEINSLQTVIKHLKDDRLQWQHDTEELSALRIRNITLENRIKALEDQLEDAKEHHTPEMRHFERLRDKIASMEERFSNREIELKKIITQNQMTYQQDLRLEVEKWKNVVHSKNKDIEQFRSELDSILSVLKVLRRQGVTIPVI